MKSDPNPLHHRVVLNQQFQQHSMKLYEVSIRLNLGRTWPYGQSAYLLRFAEWGKTEQERFVLAMGTHGDIMVLADRWALLVLTVPVRQ